MSPFDKQKFEAIEKLRAFCRLCSEDMAHDCPVSRVIAQIQGLRGIPIIVNDKLHHVMFM